MQLLSCLTQINHSVWAAKIHIVVRKYILHGPITVIYCFRVPVLKKTLEWQLELSTSVMVSQHSEDASFVTILAFNRLDTCTVRMELVE